MKFAPSEIHERKSSRGLWLATLLLIGLIAGCVLVAYASEKLSDGAIFVLLAIMLSTSLPNLFSQFRKEARDPIEVWISEEEEKMVFTRRNTSVSFPLSDIEKLRLQYKSGVLTSILLTTQSFKELRFDDYENLEEMAEILRRHTPPEKLKIATWYHR